MIVPHLYDSKTIADAKNVPLNESSSNTSFDSTSEEETKIERMTSDILALQSLSLQQAESIALLHETILQLNSGLSTLQMYTTIAIIAIVGYTLCSMI